MAAAQELIVVPKENALTVFSEPKGLEPFMAKIRAEIDAFVPDISTKKGRDNVASIAHKVAKSKTYLDGVGKELVAELKELPKKVDASRKQMRDTLDAWKEEVRRPLTQWEQAEADRIEAHKLAIADLRSNCDDDTERTAAEIASAIALIEAVEIGPQWEEFETEAARAKDKALTDLRAKLAARERYEAEQAELARIEAEAKAREADKANRATINRAAMEAFMAGGLTEDCAKTAVTLIAKRSIPNISISY